MLQRQPNIWWGVLAGFLGGISLIIANSLGLETFGGSGVGIIAVVFFIAAGVQGLDCLLWVIGHRMDEIWTAKAITPEWMLATAMQEMTPDQLAAYVIRPVDKETMAMISGPSETYSLHIETGPLEVLGLHTLSATVVREFFRRSDSTRLCPIRFFSDGPRREDARLLTHWAVDKNLAVWAEGNKAARWVGQGYSGALKAFGLTAKELAKSDEFDEYRDLRTIYEDTVAEQEPED